MTRISGTGAPMVDGYYATVRVGNGVSLTVALRIARAELVEEAVKDLGIRGAAKELGVHLRTIQRIKYTGRNR